jgi:hypothetical protein
MFGKASSDCNALSLAHNLSEHQINQVYLSYVHAAANLDQISHTVTAHEAELGVEVRWTPDSPEYKSVLTELYLCDYRHALDHLEYLVVQRMFELSKLGMSGVGELLHLIILPR